MSLLSKWPLWMTSEEQSVFGRVSKAMRLKPQILQLEAASFRVSSGHEDREGPQDGLIYIFVLAFSFFMFHICVVCSFACAWAHVGGIHALWKCRVE